MNLNIKKVVVNMKKFLNIFTLFICTTLTIILSLIVFSFISVIIFKSLVSEKGIKQITSNVEIISLPATDILDDNESLKHVILKKATDKGVSEILVLEVLEDPDFNQLTSDFIADYSNYMLVGGEKPQLDKKEFEKLILDKRDLVKEQTGYVIVDSQVNSFINLTSDIIDRVDDTLPAKEEINNSDLFDQIIEIVYSNLFIVLVLATIILILLSFMLFRFKVSAPLLWGGISFTLAGVYLTVIAIFKSFIIKFIDNYDNIYTSIFKAVNSNLFIKVYFYGIAVLLLGVGMILLYKFIQKKKK